MAYMAADYLSTEVLTATPQKLQLLLVEGALRFAGKARYYWAAGQEEAASQALIRSQNILAELLAILKRDSEDELVRRVTGVYMFIYRALIAAGLERNEDRLDDAVRVLELERDTWRMVCEQLGSQNHEPMFAGRASFVA